MADYTDLMLRLGAAMLGGLMIGFERQWQHKSTGLRTHALVALGAAAFVWLSQELAGAGGGDPTRVIGQVVAGIGFLGAGVILHNQGSIRGINTAATIWCSAAIGCVAGTGYYGATAIATLGVLVINIVLRPIEDFLDKGNSPHPSSSDKKQNG